jgi:hypothetical protein
MPIMLPLQQADEFRLHTAVHPPICTIQLLLASACWLFHAIKFCSLRKQSTAGTCLLHVLHAQTNVPYMLSAGGAAVPVS